MTEKRTARTPSYRHHKPTNQGFVEVEGHRTYLGRYDSPETREKYHRLVAEWLANGRRLPVNPIEITVMELCSAYWQHVQSYCVRPDGSPTHEVSTIK